MGEGTGPARSAVKKFFGRAPPLFGSKSIISRFGKRFRDGQYSLVRLLFAVLLLTVPPPCAQLFVKVGARAPPCLMESAPLHKATVRQAPSTLHDCSH